MRCRVCSQQVTAGLSHNTSRGSISVRGEARYVESWVGKEWPGGPCTPVRVSAQGTQKKCFTIWVTSRSVTTHCHWCRRERSTPAPRTFRSLAPPSPSPLHPAPPRPAPSHSDPSSSNLAHHESCSADDTGHRAPKAMTRTVTSRPHIVWMRDTWQPSPASPRSSSREEAHGCVPGSLHAGLSQPVQLGRVSQAPSSLARHWPRGVAVAHLQSCTLHHDPDRGSFLTLPIDGGVLMPGSPPVMHAAVEEGVTVTSGNIRNTIRGM
ncbi:hypothetical protein E2C01_030766 [Portunus trituberculatus]|uniref:Uncharacterized protein n=1 Tax=Portunus trituberculatus TaxID=210409 RepID=A0A5B7ERW1_PORTR|nr:hypothetical protein [Portunus trituberculatus]